MAFFIKKWCELYDVPYSRYLANKEHCTDEQKQRLNRFYERFSKVVEEVKKE